MRASLIFACLLGLGNTNCLCSVGMREAASLDASPLQVDVHVRHTLRSAIPDAGTLPQTACSNVCASIARSTDHDCHGTLLTICLGLRSFLRP